MPLRSLILILTLCLLPGAAGTVALHAAIAPLPIPDGTMAREPAAGLFLVAQRDLQDPHFSRSVIYLLEHGPRGTTGLIVNRPVGMKLSDVVADIGEQDAAGYTLYFGGPVHHSQVLMLMRNATRDRLIRHIDADIYLSADRNVMNRLLAENKPTDELHFYLGHAGWAAGQLARELERDSWHVVRKDARAIFTSNPGTLWERLIDRLEPDGLYVQGASATGT